LLTIVVRQLSLDPATRDAYVDHGAVCAVVDAAIVTVSGVDSTVYLQGQLSADVAALQLGQTCRALLLHPTGKLCAWLSVARTSDEHFVLVGAASTAPSIVERLSRFRLRSNVEIVGVERQVLAIRAIDPSFVEHLVGDLASVNDARWRGDASVDVVFGSASDSLVVGQDPSMLVVPAAELAALDVWRALPTWGSELADDALPAESGVVTSSVSFTKGCYTGQELTARMDSRNTTPPRVLAVTRSSVGSIATVLPDSWEVTSRVVCGDDTVELGWVSRAHSPQVERVTSELVAPLSVSLRSST